MEATRQQDKRSILRRRTQQLVYLELGKENGGVMLNLSEHGCGFQAITPVKRGETRFGFQINGGRRIAGDAEVVWTDDDGVMGGLRFLNLPVEAHREIRTWLDETNAPPEHGYAPEVSTTASSGARRSRAMGADQTYTAPAPPAAGVRVVEEEPPTPTPAWLNMRAGAYGPAVDPHYRGAFQPVEPYGYAPRRSGSAWRSIAVIAILVALGVLGIMYQHDVGTSLIWLGETLTGKTKASAVPEKPAPPTAPPSTLPKSTVPAADGLSGSTVASNPDSVPEKPSANANVDSSDASRDQNDTGLPRDRDPAIAGREYRAPGTPPAKNRYGASSESMLERPGDRLPKDELVWNQGDSVEALWGGVQSGSVSAEMTLAERFAHGEGVNKNCDQAKVLMKAAADRGNREARLRLYQMETAGCR